MDGEQVPNKLFHTIQFLSKPIIGGKYVAANQQNPDNPKIPDTPKIHKQKTPPAAKGARGYQIQRL